MTTAKITENIILPVDEPSIIKQLIKAYGPRMVELKGKIPLPVPGKSIKFMTKKMCVSIASGWRRVVCGEFVYPIFYMHNNNIATNAPDLARKTDYVQTRISLIPVSYIPEETKKSTEDRFEIDVVNTTSKLMMIRSNDIKYVGTGKSPIKWKMHHHISPLMPGTMVKMKFDLKWGTNREQSIYSKNGPEYYDVMDVDYTKVSSMISDPKEFVLGLTNMPGFNNPKDIVILGFKTLLGTLKKCTSTLNALSKEYKDDTSLPFLSDDLSVVKKDGYIRYEFYKESSTLTYILSKHVFGKNLDIAYVTNGNDHPQDNSHLVRIISPSHVKELQQACLVAQSDIESVIKQLS
jgi:hypothetical protein